MTVYILFFFPVTEDNFKILLKHGYSVLRESIGFSVAAYQDWRITVIIPIMITSNMLMIKIHGDNSALYTNCEIHVLAKYQAIGIPRSEAQIIHFTKRPHTSSTICFSVAPLTFRRQISFVRHSTEYHANPNNPMQESSILIHVNTETIRAVRNSSLCIFL